MTRLELDAQTTAAHAQRRAARRWAAWATTPTCAWAATAPTATSSYRRQRHHAHRARCRQPAAALRNGSGQEVEAWADFANILLGGNGIGRRRGPHDSNGQRRILLSADGQTCPPSTSRARPARPAATPTCAWAGTAPTATCCCTRARSNDIFATPMPRSTSTANAGDITLRNADCAEEFELMPQVVAEPGTVMALGRGRQAASFGPRSRDRCRRRRLGRGPLPAGHRARQAARPRPPATDRSGGQGLRQGHRRGRADPHRRPAHQLRAPKATRCARPIRCWPSAR